MATRISPPQNKTYYINPANLTFVENSGYGANLIQVSASSSCYISVYDPSNGIGYSDADRNYRRWKVTAYNNRFPSNDRFHIYVRLERDGYSALVVYDTVLRGVKGGEITTSTDGEGNEVKVEGEEDPAYFFVRIGEAGETDGTSIREITYDTGYLTSDEGRDTADLNEMWELDKYSTPWLVKAKQWLASFTVKGFVKLIGGLMFSKGTAGDEKAVTDIKRSVDSDNEYLQNEDGSFIVDGEGNRIKNPLYVPVSDDTLPSTMYLQNRLDSIDRKYIRKDVSDETPYDLSVGGKLTAKSELQIGDTFVTGLTGTGGRIDKDGHGELTSLSLREFLEVPELRFNRVDVVSGELWNAVAFGLIESVDTEQRICTLKLEPNERAGLAEDDICRGIFADFGEGERYEEVDECNFLHLYGFRTSYFSVVSILEDSEGVCRFTYSLRNESTPHPCPFMKFAVYGNFWDASRQASAYSTRTYKRYLNKVDQYVIDPDKHVYAQYGDLTGLVISGFEMSGYGSYQSNSYLKGVQIQLSDQQKEDLKGEDAYSVMLSDYVGVVRMDADGNIVAGEYVPLNVVSGEENVVTGDENVVTGDYILQTRVQASRGKTILAYSEGATEGTYIASISPVGCTAEITSGVISVTGISDADHCYVGIEVNCEGNASFTLTYQIKVVKDGASSVTADMDNEMDSVACDPSGKILFGLPVSTRVTMWSGVRQLAVEEVNVSAPDGVVATGVVAEDGRTAVVTVTEIPDNDADTLILPVTVTVYGVIDGFRYPKSLVFKVNKILQGEGAVIYKLSPSVSAVKIDDAGVPTSTSVRCLVMEYNGSGVRELQSLPDSSGISMEYSTDGQTWADYPYVTDIEVKTVYKSIGFRLSQEGTVVDVETIPLVNDGTNPIVVDLDNEMQSVACDKDGNVNSGLPLSATVSMWLGKTELDAVITGLTAPEGVVAEFDEGTPTLTVTSVGQEAADTSRVLIDCKATYREVTYYRSVYLSINKIRAGEDGTPATILELNPSVSSVKIGKDGSYVPSSVYCTLLKTVGSDVSDELDETPSGYSMQYSVDAGAWEDYTCGSDISMDVKPESSVAFRLYSGLKMLDAETVPVLKDGDDGKTPVVYRILSDVMTVRVGTDGAYSADTVFPSILRVEGDERTEYTSHVEGLTFTYSKDYSSDWTTVDFTYGIDVSDVKEMLSLLLKSGDVTLDKLMIPVINDGAYGETTTVYSINPSANVIMKDTSGVFNPSYIGASVMVKAGSYFDVLETLPTGYTFQLWVNSSRVDGYVYGDSYKVPSDAASVEFRLYADAGDFSGSVLVDKEIIPVLSESESVAVADLSNDMISVECDENGSPLETYTDSNYLSTTFRAYYGLQRMALSGLSASSHTGMTIVCSASTGLVKIAPFTAEAADTTEVTLTGTITAEGKTRTLVKTFTVSKVKRGQPGDPGEPGESPVVFRILSDVTTIRVDNNGEYDSTLVQPSIVQTVGGEVTELLSVPEGYTFTYNVDYGKDWTAVDFAYGIDVSGVTEMLTLLLQKGAVTVDKLMIPVIKDGAIGETTTIYAVNPSSNVVMKGTGGVMNPATVNASVMKRAGTHFDVLETLPENYYMELWVNGVKDGDYKYLETVTLNNDTEEVEFRLYADASVNDSTEPTLVDKEIIPVISSGENGKSVLVADLSNDMIAVKCDENGKPEEVYSSSNYLSTTFRAYYGLTELALQSLSASSHTGMTIACDEKTGLVKITSFGQAAADTTEVTVTAEVSAEGETKSLSKVFTVSKIRKGQQGDPGEPGDDGDDGKNGTYVEDIYMAADTQPATPSATTSIPDGWSKDIPDIFTAIEYTTSNADWEELGSYRKSSAVAVNESTYDQVTFSFTKPTWIVVELAARSFSFNYGYIGALDVDAASVETALSNYLARVAGTNKVTKSVLVPAGEHFLVIKYVKGYSSNTNGDYIQYRISGPNQVWQSRSQATWNGSMWVYGEWSEPKIYVAGSGEEELYMLAVTNEAPDAPDSPQFDNYLPVHPYFKEGLLYSAGDKVSYLGKSYECVRGTSTVAPGNTTYWKEIQYWSIVPMDVSEEYPYQYWTRRKKEYGVWSEWSAPTILSMWASGTQGKNGLNGCVTRTWEKYEEGRTYRNDTDVEDVSLLENPADGIRYIDVVVLENSGVESGYMAYQCLKQVSGENPSEQDYTNSVSASGNWRMLDNEAGLYVTTLIARNANIKFGSAFEMAVYDDGNNVVGGMRGVSEDSDIGIWYGGPTPGTAPFRVDKSGYLFASNAEITGVINAESGTFNNVDIETGKIGGFDIGEKTLKNDAGDATLTIGNLEGTKFVRLNESNALRARYDGGTAVSAYSEDTGGVAVHAQGQAGAIAVQSVGSVAMDARPSGKELITVGGLALTCKSGTNFSGASNSSVSTGWVDFLVANGNFELPSAGDCKGKILFVKASGSRTVTSSSPIVNCDGTGYYGTNSSGKYYKSLGSTALFYLSDGSVWYEFRCI